MAIRPLNNRELKQGRLRRLRERFFLLNTTLRCFNHFAIVQSRLAWKVYIRNIIGVNGVVVWRKDSPT